MAGDALFRLKFARKALFVNLYVHVTHMRYFIEPSETREYVTFIYSLVSCGVLFI